MTKVTIIGEQPKETKKKPIEFKWHIDVSGNKLLPLWKPNEFAHIEVVRRLNGFDMFICYNSDIAHSVLYLGHYNDGVIE